MTKQLNSLIYFAPLQSYTTLPYYFVFNQLFKGVSKYFTPFYRKNKKGSFEYEKQLINHCNINIIPQILTNSPEDLVLFASDMIERGFEEINLNMGCPFPMVTNRHLGCGILPYKDEIEDMLSVFFTNDLNIRLSIKTRLGWANNKEVFSLLPIINKFPVHEIILHPRLGIQKYDGEPDWDIFSKIIKGQNRRFIGNGDIGSLDELRVLENQFSEIKGWMIGRGLLKNPYMFQGDIYSGEKRKLLNSFHDVFYDKLKELGYMENQILHHLKTFWEYPMLNFVGGNRIYRKMRKAGKMVEYNDLKNRLLDLDVHEDFIPLP